MYESSVCISSPGEDIRGIISFHMFRGQEHLRLVMGLDFDEVCDVKQCATHLVDGAWGGQ